MSSQQLGKLKQILGTIQLAVAGNWGSFKLDPNTTFRASFMKSNNQLLPYRTFELQVNYSRENSLPANLSELLNGFRVGIAELPVRNGWGPHELSIAITFDE